MHLSDADIQRRLSDGSLTITPLEDPETQIQPASVDVRLADTFLRFDHPNVPALDPLEDSAAEHMHEQTIPEGGTVIVHPGDFVLASTIERVQVPTDLVGYVNGRSTLGRLGIVIHATAGLLDTGFEGTITLEISNLGSVPVKLTHKMRVAQLAFELLHSPCETPYGEREDSKYQGQSETQPASRDRDT